MNTNYVDSRTSEEKEADSKIETTVTTASAMTNTEKIEEMVRDFCSVVPKSKSEVRQRIQQALAEDREKENTATMEAIKNLNRLTFQTHITDDIRTTASMLLIAHYDEQKSKYIRDLEFRIKKEHQAREEERERIVGVAEKILQEERFSGTPYALNKLIAEIQISQK